ncbi:hypothetical protein QBC40DRAFT_295043 [Triangularia verruculosa]|uniref:Uncharacterized protein n=1 Tax=Triangularia verruculosa TaxID=2587418 RepID=A0AAN6XK29_9PEZI|nr:hypothetical protein QBC40DRAFT_295043 [Triangularia verruculosa]
MFNVDDKARCIGHVVQFQALVMSVGVLSTTLSEVEATLDHALNLYRLWNVMILLDKTYVLLATRSDEGLIRNELFVVIKSDLNRLCELNLNGREEIKNICKTALPLSGRDNNGVVKSKDRQVAYAGSEANHCAAATRTKGMLKYDRQPELRNARFLSLETKGLGQ